MSQENVGTNLPARRRGMTVCLLISALVIGLYFIPYGQYVLYPLMLVYTFIHEMGHGIAAFLMGGDFVKFEMWLDGSGVATSALPIDASRLSKAFVAFGGLVAPAVMAAVCLILGRSNKASRVGLYVFSGICALSLILVVRNLFGMVFVALCGAICFGLAYFKRQTQSSLPQYSMLFVAITLLTAVFSRGDYLFTATAETSGGTMPSDVGQIANYLFLPYWFWGGLIAVVSVATLVLGVRGFFYTAPKNTGAPKKLQSEE